MDRPLVLYYDDSRAVSQCKEPRNHKKGKNIERKYPYPRVYPQGGDSGGVDSFREESYPFTKPLAEKMFKDTQMLSDLDSFSRAVSFVQV